MIRQASGKESSEAPDAQFWAEDNQYTGKLISSTMPDTVTSVNSSFVRLNNEPFKALMMRVELVMGHAKEFSQ
jgi:hypothetical protein